MENIEQEPAPLLHLNLNPILEIKKYFWQTWHKYENVESANEALIAALEDPEFKKQNLMINGDPKIYLDKAFKIYQKLIEINKMEKGPDEDPEGYVIKKHNLIDQILGDVEKDNDDDTFVSLIRDTIPLSDNLKKEDLDNLIKKLTTYDKRHYLPLLFINLNFLIQSKFFRTDEAKINRFAGIYAGITACEGGNYNQFSDETGGNDIIETGVTSFFKNYILKHYGFLVEPGMDIHTTALVREYLLSLPGADPHALSMFKYFPTKAMRELFEKTITGNIVEPILRTEIENYLRNLLTTNFSNISEEKQWEIITYYKQDNEQGEILRYLFTDLVNKISMIYKGQKERVQDGDFKLLDHQEEFTNIILDESYKLRSEEEKKKLIQKQGGVNSVIAKTTNNIFSIIKEKIMGLSYSEPVKNDENTFLLLKETAKIYSDFLKQNSSLTIKEFSEKLFNISQINDGSISLKNDIAEHLPKRSVERLKFILDQLRFNKEQIIEPKENYLSAFFNTLKENEEIIKTDLTKNSLIIEKKSSEQYLLSTIERNLFTILDNPASHYNQNKHNLEYLEAAKGKIILDYKALKFIGSSILPENFVELLGNGVLQIRLQHQEQELTDQQLKENDNITLSVIKAYGRRLLQSYPDKFLEMISEIKTKNIIREFMLIPDLSVMYANQFPVQYLNSFIELEDDKNFALKFLSQYPGVKFAEDHSEQYSKIVLGIMKSGNNAYIQNFVKSPSIKAYADQNLPQLFKILNETGQFDLIKFFLKAEYGNNLALQAPDDFVEVFKSITKDMDITNSSSFLNDLGSSFAILVKEHTAHANKLLDKVAFNKSKKLDEIGSSSANFYQYLEKFNIGKIMSDHNPIAFFNFLRKFYDNDSRRDKDKNFEKIFKNSDIENNLNRALSNTNLEQLKELSEFLGDAKNKSIKNIFSKTNIGKIIETRIISEFTASKGGASKSRRDDIDQYYNSTERTDDQNKNLIKEEDNEKQVEVNDNKKIKTNPKNQFQVAGADPLMELQKHNQKFG